MRRSFLTVVFILAFGLALPAATPANPPGSSPQLDTATASGDNLGVDDFSAIDIEVDAHSGPLGESPGGSASFNSGGLLPISGPITCLNVSGNTALMTVDGPFPSVPYSGFIVKLIDNGGGGLDRFEYFPTFAGTPNPIDCYTGSPYYFGGPLIGRAEVTDAPSPPPSITIVSPDAGATGVQRAAPVVAFFDHAMNKTSAQAAFSLTRTSTGAPVPGSFGWYGSALIFAPTAPLASGAGYTATVGSGAKDIVGNPLTSPKTWQFSTASQPLVAAVVPAEDATEVLPNGLVVVAFDTAIDKPTAEAAFSLKRTSDGAPVAGRFGWYGGAGLIFKPSADLAGGTQYTATVSTAARDLGGNPLPAAKAWRFTTTSRPIIDLVHPADGTTGVSRTGVIVAFFNKPMAKASAQAAFSLKRTGSGAAVGGSFGWYGNALLFKPSSALPANALFTAAVSATAKDITGNSLANPTTWHFATGG